jgi:hypothetical protein
MTTSPNEPILADRAAEASTNDTLETVAGQAQALVASGDKLKDKAEEKYLSAGLLLIKLKERLPVERPGVAWELWAAANLPNIKRSRQYALIRIAQGKTTVEAEREKNAQANRDLRERKAAAAEPSPSRDGQPVVDPVPEAVEVAAGIEAGAEQWAMSLSNHASEAISMGPLWTRLFGDWRRFEVTSTAATLARQAARAWGKLADELAPAPVVEVSQVQSESLLDVFGDPAAPLHDKIVAAIKFCLVPSEQKAALDAIGIADPTVTSPDLSDIWVTASKDEKIEFLDKMGIAPEARPWFLRPALPVIEVVEVAVPEALERETQEQTDRRIFLWLANGQATAANEMLDEIETTNVASVEYLTELVGASKAVAGIWTRIEHKLRGRLVCEQVAAAHVEVDPIPEPELDRSAPWNSLDAAVAEARAAA